MHPLGRGLLLCFTFVRIYWIWHSGSRVFELLSANPVGPAILWMVSLALALFSWWGIKKGYEQD